MNNDVTEFLLYVKELSVSIGERAIMSDGEAMAKKYLKGVLNQLKNDCDKVVCQSFKYEKNGVNGDLTNIILIKQAKSKANRIISFGAHYDSVTSCPGAMDNASGVAMVLLLAKMFKDVAFNDVEVRFILFAGEEVGCVGSSSYVKSLSIKEKSIYSAAVVFDIFISKLGEDSALVVNTQGGRYATGRIKGAKFKYKHGEEAEPTCNAVASAISSSFNSVISEAKVAVATKNNKDSNNINNTNFNNDDYTNKLGTANADTLLWCPRHYGHSDHASFHLASIDSANVTIRGDKKNAGKLPSGYHAPQDFYQEDKFDLALLEMAISVVKDASLSLASNPAKF